MNIQATINKEPGSQIDDIKNNTNEILALPSSSEGPGARQITFGETLKLDELGPMIINTGIEKCS
jgi:hypothetical protein